MTEQSKIPVPGKGPSSLLERASGAFGLDPFRPKAPKRDLPPEERKREPQAAASASEPAAPAAEARAPATVAETAAPGTARESAPVEAPAAPAPIRQAVAFTGPHQPVDRLALQDRGMIVPGAQSGALIEEFRIIKRQLLASARASDLARDRRILITSPMPGDGKTFCAINLAMAMSAERECEVLLVDADFAKPSIVSTLGLSAGPGLLDALTDESARVEDMVIGTDVPGLWVLPAGSRTDADSEYLSSTLTTTILDRLTEGAPQRIVIFDSPPALAASPAAELAKHVGQTVLVARADVTGQSAIEDSIRLLGACADIKLLLNATKFSPSGRRFGTYYGYGE